MATTSRGECQWVHRVSRSTSMPYTCGPFIAVLAFYLLLERDALLEAKHRLHQGEVRKGLRKIAHQPLGVWVIFLAQEAQIVTQRQQPLQKGLGVRHAALKDIAVGKPEAAR